MLPVGLNTTGSVSRLIYASSKCQLGSPAGMNFQRHCNWTSSCRSLNQLLLTTFYMQFLCTVEITMEATMWLTLIPKEMARSVVGSFRTILLTLWPLYLQQWLKFDDDVVSTVSGTCTTCLCWWWWAVIGRCLPWWWWSGIACLCCCENCSRVSSACVISIIYWRV